MIHTRSYKTHYNQMLACIYDIGEVVTVKFIDKIGANVHVRKKNILMEIIYTNEINMLSV